MSNACGSRICEQSYVAYFLFFDLCVYESQICDVFGFGSLACEANVQMSVDYYCC